MTQDTRPPKSSQGGTALLIQKVQNGVVGDETRLPELAAAAQKLGVVGNIARLADAARLSGVWVVHATAENLPGGFGWNHNARLFSGARRMGAKNVPGTTSVQPLAKVWADGDVVLPRFHGLSPLTGGSLDSLLRNAGVTQLVVSGVSRSRRWSRRTNSFAAGPLHRTRRPPRPGCYRLLRSFQIATTGACMTVNTDRVTRFAADLIDSATVEGARQSRSAKQQLDHWARVGRSVSMHHTAARRRVEAALDGSLPLADLTADERLVVNAEIDAAIQENLHSTHYGQRLAAEGIATVALDEHGNLIEHHPDGRTTPLATSSA